MSILVLWYDMAKHMLWFGETLDSRIDQHRTSGLGLDRMRWLHAFLDRTRWLHAFVSPLSSVRLITCDSCMHPHCPQAPPLAHSLPFIVSGSECCSASVEALLEASFITITMLGTIIWY